MKAVGQRVKALRLSKGMTQQDICGDESGLTIRQLIRIEKGHSQPNLEHLTYLAQRLGVHVYELVGDYQDLPQTYLRLKYWILRHDDYGDVAIKEQKEAYFDQIFEAHYEHLPIEEQFAIDCMAATNQIRLTHDLHYGLSVIEESLAGFLKKAVYTTNDLIFIRMLSEVLETSLTMGMPFPQDKQLSLPLICERLLAHHSFVGLHNLFIFRDALISLLRYFDRLADYQYYSKALALLECIMEQTQDYQKKPVLLMLQWKEALFIHKRFEQAQASYQEAVALGKLLAIPGLLYLLDHQWKKDLHQFYVVNP